MKSTLRNHGFALITALALLVVLMALLTAYFALTTVEVSTTKSSVDSSNAFFAAEAGLNVRGQKIRQQFEGYNRPGGVSPDDVNNVPCSSGNQGSGDFGCTSYTFGGKNVYSYVIEETPASGPESLTIPPGEKYAGLNAQEYTYTAYSVAQGSDNQPGAILGLRFRSRLVPMFQFAAFYDKDLEILNGPPLILSGPIHVNGDLYLNAGSNQKDLGEITVAVRDDGTGGNLHRGRKNSNTCGGTVKVAIDGSVYVDGSGNIVNGSSLKKLNCDGSSYTPVSYSLDPWNSRIRINENNVDVPPPEAFGVGGGYWNNADLRIVLDLNDNNGNPPTIEVRRQDETVNAVLTTTLESCLGSGAAAPYTSFYPNLATSSGARFDAGPLGNRAVEASYSFFNNRENRTSSTKDYPVGSNTIMLEIDLQALLTCIGDHPSLLSEGSAGGTVGLADQTQGGLVMYLTVDGSISGQCGNRNCINNYGVRVWDGGQLKSNNAGHPEIQGLTLVSDQAVYIKGDYNTDTAVGDTWYPAAIISDSLNVLSNAWNDANGGNGVKPNAADTTINAAFLQGTDSTGGKEGYAGQGGGYNGGLENYPRFHEKWGSSRTMRYRGSFVSLDIPKHVNGAWGKQIYSPPSRDWGFDVRFTNAANLPPLSPRFVYLRQQLFTRDFEQ